MKFPNPKYSRRGQALIEFMIYFPLTLIFAFSLLEMGMEFNVSQKVTNVSREAANAALRACGTQAADPTAMGVCLENIAYPTVENIAKNSFKDYLSSGQVILSVYWNGGNACFSGGKEATCTNSRFNAANLQDLIDKFDMIFVGEFIYDYKIGRASCRERV